jgi:uncharacterized protein YraI
MTRFISVFAMALALLLAAGPAKAAITAYSAGTVNMRAGPGTNFPVVATIKGARQIGVHGCVQGWSWCEVTWNGRRGWVSASRINASFRSRRVSLYDYGPRLGLPVVSFSQRSYWDRYYRGESFYRGDRDYCPCARRSGGRRSWDNDRWDNGNDDWYNE